MSTPAALQSPPLPSRPHIGERELVVAVLAVLLTAVFAGTWAGYLRGWQDEDNRHGIVVLPLAALWIWMHWTRLRAVPLGRSVTAGLAVLGLALAFQVAGVWLGLNRAAGYAFPLAVTGLCLYFLGARMTRALAFPLAFLLFMVPLPAGVIDLVSAPLQVLCAKMATMLAGLSGASVRNEGVNLLLPARHVRFEVAVACSGLHSLTAMAMLAALLAGLTVAPLAGRWLLFALALPLAVAGNVLRLYLVLMAADAGGQAAGNAFHDGFAGKMVPFLLAFGVLLALGWWLGRRYGPGREPALTPPAAGPAAVLPALGLRTAGPALGLLLAAAALIVLGLRQPVRPAPHADLNALPARLGDWAVQWDEKSMPGLAFAPSLIQALSLDSYTDRVYQDRRSGRQIALLLEYRTGDRGAFNHRPEACYPAVGYVLSRRAVTPIVYNGRPARAVTVQADYSGDRGRSHQVLLYWFASGARCESSFWKQQVLMAVGRLHPQTNGWAFARLVTEARPGDEAAALAAEKDLAAQVSPDLVRLMTASRTAAP